MKLSSLLRDPEKLIICKIYASAASAQLLNLWKKTNRVHLKKTLLKLQFDCFVSPTLQMRYITTGKTDAEKLDSFHRKQLRKVLYVAYLHK